MFRKLVTSFDAAGPPYTLRIEADLIGLWGVYAGKADLRRANNKRVAINNSRNAREISAGLCGGTHERHCCEYHHTESHRRGPQTPKTDRCWPIRAARRSERRRIAAE